MAFVMFVFLVLLLSGSMLVWPISTLCRPAFPGLWLKDTYCNSFALFSLTGVRVVFVVLDICVSLLATIGVMYMLWTAAFGVVLFLQLALVIVLAEQNLPFVACFIFCVYYFWHNFNSFTKQYHFLAETLFKHQEKSMEDIRRMLERTRYSGLIHLFSAGMRRGSVQKTDDRKGNRRPQLSLEPSSNALRWEIPRRILKALFSRACEELMPIRINTRKLVSKVILDLTFIILAFSLAMLLNANPLIRSLLICSAGSVPMIMSFIHTCRRQQANLSAFDENACQMVKNYVDESRKNTDFLHLWHSNRPTTEELNGDIEMNCRLFNALIICSVFYCFVLFMYWL